MSPAIHNKAFRELGLEIEYSLCDTDPGSLESKIDELVSDGRIIGFNVTIPFKERVLHRMTSLDPIAKAVRAINLVVISVDRKKMLGCNTDVDGIVASFSKLGLIGRSGLTAVILGSGGAARACVFALLKDGFDVVRILNRTENRVKELMLDFSRDFPTKKIESFSLSQVEFESALKDADLLINAIPYDAEFPFEVSFASAPKEMKFLDLNYRKNPPVLRIAKKEGIVSIDGSLMLVEQAARSFEILTGISAPRKTMMLAARKQIAHD